MFIEQNGRAALSLMPSFIWLISKVRRGQGEVTVNLFLFHGSLEACLRGSLSLCLCSLRFVLLSASSLSFFYYGDYLFLLRCHVGQDVCLSFYFPIYFSLVVVFSFSLILPPSSVIFFPLIFTSFSFSSSLSCSSFFSFAAVSTSSFAM